MPWTASTMLPLRTRLSTRSVPLGHAARVWSRHAFVLQRTGFARVSGERNSTVRKTARSEKQHGPKNSTVRKTTCELARSIITRTVANMPIWCFVRLTMICLDALNRTTCLLGALTRPRIERHSQSHSQSQSHLTVTLTITITVPLTPTVTVTITITVTHTVTAN